MKRPLAMIGGTAATAFFRRRSAMLLATASAFALLSHVPVAAAVECGGAPPADVASPAALYETLRDRTDAQLLAMGFAQRPAADCAWVYEVKMLTVSGSVVELDFTAQGLDLIGARGPDDDKELARLVRGLGGNPSTVVTDDTKGNGGGASGGGDSGEGSDNSGSGSGGSGSSSGSGGGDDGGSEGGESGNSGSGSSGSGGGDDGGGDDGGGDDGGGDDGGSEGGEGGNSGSGSGSSGGSDGGGEGGDD